MDDKKTMLDLREAFARDTVTLPDGTVCELRNQAEFGVLDEFRLRSLVDEVKQLSTVNSPEDADRAARLLHDVAAMIVVDCPDDLPDWATVRIFRFWTERVTGGAPVPPPKPARSRRTTGGSSRASNASTAAIRKRGSTSPSTS